MIFADSLERDVFANDLSESICFVNEVAVDSVWPERIPFDWTTDT